MLKHSHSYYRNVRRLEENSSNQRRVKTCPNHRIGAKGKRIIVGLRNDLVWKIDSSCNRNCFEKATAVDFRLMLV